MPVRGATSPGRIICTPANSVFVARDLPGIPGFSRMSTRRSASSAVMSPPDSITRRLMSSKCQITGAQRVTGSLVTTFFITFQSGVMWCLAMRW